jgi:hypothetical protein
MDFKIVSIGLEYYTELLETKNKYDAIITSIFDNEHLRLNYSCDDLALDFDDTSKLIKIFENDKYKEKLQELKKERETKENE